MMNSTKNSKNEETKSFESDEMIHNHVTEDCHETHGSVVEESKTTHVDLDVDLGRDKIETGSEYSEEDSFDFSTYDSEFGRFVRNDLQERFNLPDPPVRMRPFEIPARHSRRGPWSITTTSGTEEVNHQNTTSDESSSGQTQPSATTDSRKNKTANLKKSIDKK